MNKTKKKILFISDDFGESSWDLTKEFCEHGDYFYSAESNWLEFEFHLIEDFDKLTHERYDAILVDYGLINDVKNVRVLERLYKDGIPIAWVGGLDSWYNEDAKEQFPDFPLLHNLPTSCTGCDDILVLLYEIFRDSREMEESK